MPLIDLKTSLKSLKYGKDRPYEGSSNQPYIQSSIPEGDIPSSGGPDFILRGGILAPVRAAKDVSRLTQMFFDLKSPNGSLFIAKQNILSRTSVQTEASTGAGYGGNFVNQGVYLPSSTLAQAGVGFTGTHLNLLGIDPSSPMTGVTQTSLSSLFFNRPDSKPVLTLGLNRYEDIVKEANKLENNKETSISVIPESPSLSRQSSPFLNRNNNFVPSLSTNNSPFSSNSNISFSTPDIKSPGPLNEIKVNPANFSNRLLRFWNTSQIQINNTGILNSYPGGPGSILGVGTTTIPFADQRTGVNNIELQNQEFFLKGYSIFGRKTTVQSYLAAGNTGKANNLDINYVNAVPSGSSKGASSTYESLLGGQPVNNNIDYRLNSRGNTYNFNIYKSGSLTPDLEFISDFKKSTTKSPKINFTGSVPSGSIKGVSSTYGSFTGQPVDNKIIYPANRQVGTYDFSVYNKGTFNPSNLSKTQTGPFRNTAIYTYDQSQLIDSSKSSGSQAFKEDFRKTLLPPDSTFNSILSISPSYVEFNISERTNAGDPGYSNTPDGIKNVLDYTAASGNGIPNDYKLALDKITAGKIYSRATALHNKDNGEYAGNDLVKFSIGVIQNNTTGNSNYMHFRAFIDSFSDSYTSDWNSYNYVGRGDKFYNYTGFERTVNLSFTVFAQSKAELIPMYKKLNYLASSLAPNYSDVGGFMKGNLHKMTIGGYLFEQVGIIKSLTYDIPEETSWEIGIDNVGGEDTSVKELPHMIKVTNLTFVPIQSFLPRVADDIENQSKTRYIALAANTSDDKTNYTRAKTT